MQVKHTLGINNKAYQIPTYTHYNNIYKKKYIDMLNVVLDLKCILLNFVLETINYNKVDPVFSELKFP